ncbi:MAG: low molecular weight protein arginine phosphatase [Planctomycetota bacterium]
MSSSDPQRRSEPPDDPDGALAGVDQQEIIRRDLLHERLRTLADGGTAEIDAADGPFQVRSLLAAGDPASQPGDGPPVLLLRHAAELLDYFPHLSEKADRTVARWWPGPVAVEVDGPLGGLAGAVNAGGGPSNLAADGSPPTEGAARFRTRCSQDAATAAALELSPAPLVQVGGTPAETIVHLRDDGRWEVLLEGPITEAELTQRQAETVLFVCTGNTCRSPLAEALLRKRLHDAGGETVHAVSAGLSAGYGQPASPESFDLARRAGAELSDHRSQPLTEELLEDARKVYCMTQWHRAAILQRRPDLRDRVALLSADGGDIPDPIGGGMAEYEACRDAIDRGLDHVMAELGFDGSGDDPKPGGG